MASTSTFNATVAACTRTAEHIAGTPDMLALYESHGGLKSDLESIGDAGRRAELLSHSRGAVRSDGSAATMQVLQSFAGLKRDYGALMAVAHAVRLDMQDNGAPTDTLAALDQILVNEASVVMRTVEKNGEKKKVAVKSKSQEAQRAEIHKDASALLELNDVLKAMAKRKVSAARIKSLRDAAQALAGKPADRSAAKGAGKVVRRLCSPCRAGSTKHRSSQGGAWRLALGYYVMPLRGIRA